MFSEWIRKDVQGKSRCLIEVLTRNLSAGNEKKNTNNHLRGDFWIRYIPKTK